LANRYGEIFFSFPCGGENPIVHEGEKEILCYRLECPILRFQLVKGVHIRSYTATNFLLVRVTSVPSI